MRARARNSSTLSEKSGSCSGQSSMKMPARREGGFPVFPYIHRALHAVSIDRAFEGVTDAGSLVTMIAVAAQPGALNFSADVRGEEFAAMTAHHLLSFLFEEQRVRGV